MDIGEESRRDISADQMAKIWRYLEARSDFAWIQILAWHPAPPPPTTVASTPRSPGSHRRRRGGTKPALGPGGTVEQQQPVVPPLGTLNLNTQELPP